MSALLAGDSLTLPRATHSALAMPTGFQHKLKERSIAWCPTGHFSPPLALQMLRELSRTEMGGGAEPDPAFT